MRANVRANNHARYGGRLGLNYMKAEIALTLAFFSLGLALLGALLLFAPSVVQRFFTEVPMDNMRYVYGSIALVGGLLSAGSNWRWYRDEIHGNG